MDRRRSICRATGYNSALNNSQTPSPHRAPCRYSGISLAPRSGCGLPDMRSCHTENILRKQLPALDDPVPNWPTQGGCRADIELETRELSVEIESLMFL